MGARLSATISTPPTRTSRAAHGGTGRGANAARRATTRTKAASATFVNEQNEVYNDAELNRRNASSSSACHRTDNGASATSPDDAWKAPG